MRSDLQQDCEPLLELITRIFSRIPPTVIGDLTAYFHALAQLSRIPGTAPWKALFVEAVTMPLRIATKSSKPKASYRFLRCSE